MRYASKLSQATSNHVLETVVHPSVFARLELTTLPDAEQSEIDDVLTLIYRSNQGFILYRFDGIRIVIEAIENEKLMLRCAIRDRQLDGTNERSPLTAFPNSDPACNRLPAPDFCGAELSIYSYDPDTYLSNIETPGTLGHFIADPDCYIWAANFDPKTFFPLWQAAFASGRAPWQKAMPMRDVSKFFVLGAAKLLRELGYHRVDAVPSWFNVANFFQRMGYQFTYGEHYVAYNATWSHLMQHYKHLSLAQMSWLVALQNMPEKFLPTELKLPARWPVTHTNQYWVRIHMDLNQFSLPEGLRSLMSAMVVH